MAYSIAYRITNDATLAEDVVQDAFLGAWRNAARYVESRGELAGAYVLGALEPGEAAAVRSHLTAHPDGHPEIAELGAVIPAFADSVPIVEPPDSLKGRIMAAAAADLAARGGATGTTVTAETPAPPVAFPGPEEREARRERTSPATWGLRIAAVLAIALLGGWNLLLQNDLGAARQLRAERGRGAPGRLAARGRHGGAGTRRRDGFGAGGRGCRGRRGTGDA